MAGSTSRAALTGTLSLSVPAGRSRKPFTTSSAASTSVSAGPSRSSRRAPASVGTTLRVVRLSSLTPSLASSRRTASLSPDALPPLARAPSRKPLGAGHRHEGVQIAQIDLHCSPFRTTCADCSAIIATGRRRLAMRRHTKGDRSCPASTSPARFTLGDRTVKRLGYGAMQLAGPGVFGPPKDRDAALAVLREAVARGVNHIDTSDFYGPHVTNQLIREALAPYPDDLVIVTKIGARRGEDGSWLPAFSPEELTQAVHDNLRNLGPRRARGRQPSQHVRRPWPGRRVDRGAAHRPGRAAAPGPGASHRAEQRHARADRGRAADLRDRLRAEPVQPGASGRRRR